MRLVIIESPFHGEEQNIKYAKEAMKDCFNRGEAPFASHLLYPGTLDDSLEDQRDKGIKSGLAWGEKADATVVYFDKGITAGMEEGISHAISCGRKIEFRSLPLYESTTSIFIANLLKGLNFPNLYGSKKENTTLPPDPPAREQAMSDREKRLSDCELQRLLQIAQDEWKPEDLARRAAEELADARAKLAKVEAERAFTPPPGGTDG